MGFSFTQILPSPTINTWNNAKRTHCNKVHNMILYCVVHVCCSCVVHVCSVVASAIFCGAVCWSSCILAEGRKRLDKLIKEASSSAGPLDPVQVVGESRMTDKLSSLLVKESHPLQVTLTALGSSFSNRLIHPKCVKERHRRSFPPAAVRLYNQHWSQ